MKPKVKIIARPHGAWQLKVDGELSHKAPYDHPIIFNGVVAFTSYYGEAAYILGEKLEHMVEDKSLERFTATQQ